MIERYDFGQLKLNSQEYLHGFEFCILADIAHLLRPPTCDKDNKPVFYTPTQWQQWFVDNRLPVQEWTGPVWAKHCRCPEFEIYERESNIEIYFHESWTVLIAKLTG